MDSRKKNFLWKLLLLPWFYLPKIGISIQAKEWISVILCKHKCLLHNCCSQKTIHTHSTKVKQLVLQPNLTLLPSIQILPSLYLRQPNKENPLSFLPFFLFFLSSFFLSSFFLLLHCLFLPFLPFSHPLIQQTSVKHDPNRHIHWPCEVYIPVKPRQDTLMTV